MSFYEIYVIINCIPITILANSNGNITDTFTYDTYGKLINRTGTSFVIFGYNGRDGVITDTNGLIYMRARYYSSELRRFINADIIAGEITNAITLNRYAYANGNPVSNIDPFGLSAERGSESLISKDDPYGLSLHRKSSFDNGLDSYLICQQIINNPWYELKYPGQIHRLVVLYLSTTHGLIPEYVPENNKSHRYDLYFPHMYWEVKPSSYRYDPIRAAKMEAQMQGYDSDGVIRGYPLGKDEFTVGDYTIKIYSEVPGKIYYTFQKEQKQEQEQEQEQEELVIIPAKEPSEELENSPGLDWQPIIQTASQVGLVATGLFIVAMGLYQLLTTGDTSGIQRGTQLIQQAAG